MQKNVIENISKEDLLQGISEMFYDKNFGVKTKSDIELFLFKLYFDAASKLSMKNGTFNENSISDYKIGRDLGITPSKVKNLRLKMELQYVIDYDWRKELRTVLCNVKNLTKENGYIKINIRSKNLHNAIRDWIEDIGGIVEITFNNNELKVSEEYMINLVLHVLPPEDSEAIISKISEELSKKHLTIKKSGFDIVKSCSEIGVNISEIILNISNIFSPKTQVCEILNNIITIFKN